MEKAQRSLKNFKDPGRSSEVIGYPKRTWEILKDPDQFSKILGDPRGSCLRNHGKSLENVQDLGRSCIILGDPEDLKRSLEMMGNP